MAPTTDTLLDFVGRAICGLPLLRRMTALLMGAVAYDPKVGHHLDRVPRLVRDQGLDFDFVLYSNYDVVAGRIHARVELTPGLGSNSQARPAARA